MADYCVYKYEFVSNNENWLFANKETGEEVDADYLRRTWGENLKTNRTIPLMKRKDGEMVAVSAYILSSHDDVSIMAVHNIKNIKRWLEMAEKPETLESNPHCLVIIDNRKGVQQILIEKNGAFNGRPDVALWMLKHHIDELFAPFSCCLEVRGKIHAGDFWRVVDDHRKNGKTMTSMKIAIGASEQMDLAGIQKNDMLMSLIKWRGIVGAAFAEFRAQAKKNSDLSLVQANDDCRNIVELCAHNGYSITARFKDGGVYKSGKQATAYFPMPKGIESAFINHHPLLDGRYELLKWLDNIRTDNNAYTDVPLKEERR